MGGENLTGSVMVAHSMSRRTFTAALVAAVLGNAFNAGAAAQVTDQRPPTVDTSNLRKVAEGVWVIQDHRTWLVPNIGIILGRDAALVVDTGLGPANGERVLALTRQIAGNRRLLLTLTHFHPEHGYGAQAFQPDATIIYNRTQRDELQEKGARYIDLFRKTQGKAVADALDGTRIVMPHFVYDGLSTQIDLGDRKVELHTWGTAHTRGDQVVFLPQERILFAGDLIEERMFPIFPWFPPKDVDVDSTIWVRILNAFESFNPAVIVPGHGNSGDMQIARNLTSHIEAVGKKVRRLRAGGRTSPQIIAEVKSKIVGSYPGWEHASLLDWEIGYFAARPA